MITSFLSQYTGPYLAILPTGSEGVAKILQAYF